MEMDVSAHVTVPLNLPFVKGLSKQNIMQAKSDELSKFYLRFYPDSMN